MKLLQKGFSTVLLIIAVAVLITAGFIGLKVYRSGQKPAHTLPTPATMKTYEDTAKKFTFSYPADWTVAVLPAPGTDGVQPPEPDWSKVSRPVVLKPASGAANNNVSVTPGCETTSNDGNTTVSALQSIKDRKDKFHEQQSLTINGHEGFYDRVNYTGDAESYLDHTYFITNSTSCLVLAYRENWHHPMSNKDFDDSKNMPGLKSIVTSVKFTQ